MLLRLPSTAVSLEVLAALSLTCLEIFASSHEELISLKFLTLSPLVPLSLLDLGDFATGTFTAMLELMLEIDGVANTVEVAVEVTVLAVVLDVEGILESPETLQFVIVVELEELENTMLVIQLNGALDEVVIVDVAHEEELVGVSEFSLF